ncbi:hypothetical protein ABK040_004724 [Willaertia magna]
MAESTTLDTTQLQLMDIEDCILVTEQDVIKGRASKKESHIWTNIDSVKGDDKSPYLHRAFSVFLFNTKGELLLQQRASEKITFPDYWTNTCCSHPLAGIEEEKNGVQGVKLAAKRKLEHEIGIPSEKIDIDRFIYLTRILYKAPSNTQWGEHEVDYCLFYILNDENEEKELVREDLMNRNEIKAIKFVTMEELREMIEKKEELKIEITPWFERICKRFIFGWWKALQEDLKSETKDWKNVIACRDEQSVTVLE